jgi:hypothetical protein
MDAARFDALTRRLTEFQSRRRVLVTLRGLGIVGTASRWPWDAAEAKKKKRKKPKKNQFGCIDVGKKCYGKDTQCCSGICEGKKKTSKCVAHHVRNCTAEDNSCAESIPCGGNGECFRTTGKGAFCGAVGTCDCHPCNKDADCVAEFGEGAACIVCTADEVGCIGVNGSNGTACVPPAPIEI